jgi:iron complex outermembrane recepter protein
MRLQAFCATLIVLLLAGASDSFASNDVVATEANDTVAAASATVRAQSSAPCKPAATKTCPPSVQRTRVADARPINPATPTPAVADATIGPQNGGLATIVVTARRFSENLQNVPVTVSAFNSEQLRTFQVSTVADLAELVPGFDLVDAAGQAYPFIRGLGIQSSGPWQESAVGTYIDGVYFESSNISNAILNNIAAVEVDKGPQGTLFGRNTIGGLVSYTTRDPSQTPHADVSVGYGNFDTWTGDLYATSGIAPNLAANLAISAENQEGGWGRNLYAGGEAHTGNAYSARSKWLWTPGDNTTVTWIINYNRSAEPEAGLEIDRGVFPFITTGPTHVGGFYDTYGPTIPTAQFADDGTSLRVDQDFGWVKFASISAVNQDTETKNTDYGFNVPFLPATPAVGQINGNKIDGYAKIYDSTETQEFQLLSPDTSKVKWVAGAYLLFDSAGVNPSENDKTVMPTGSQGVLTFDQQKTQSYSGYAQATVPLFTGTSLTLGARDTSDHRAVYGASIENTVADQVVFTPVAKLSAAANPEPSVTANKPTFTAALTHNLTESILTYLSFSTGFQSPYYSISSGANAVPVKPETIQNYEVGVKTNLLDNTLRVNASLFLYNLNNMVVNHQINGNTVTNNAAEAQAKGTDVDLTYEPIPRLTFGASVEYVDPEYTNYQDSVSYIPNASGSFAAVAANATDFQVSYTEKFMGTADVSYGVPTNVGEFNFAGAITYHSGIHYDTQDLVVEPPYALVNASLRWTDNSGKLDVTLWSKNLTNKQYASGYITDNVVMMYDPAPPRTYGLQFGYHF